MFMINIHVKHEFLLNNIFKKPVHTLYETLHFQYEGHSA
jgi:hypothetical protein